MPKFNTTRPTYNLGALHKTCAFPHSDERVAKIAIHIHLIHVAHDVSHPAKSDR